MSPGRDHRVDRAVLRRRQLDRAADRRLGQVAPDDLVDDVDLGEDLRVLVALARRATWIRYASIAWRFLTAIETTSIAEHAASAARIVSTGLPPWFDDAVVEGHRVPRARVGREQHPALVAQLDRLRVGIGSDAGQRDRRRLVVVRTPRPVGRQLGHIAGSSARNCSR